MVISLRICDPPWSKGNSPLTEGAAEDPGEAATFKPQTVEIPGPGVMRMRRGCCPLQKAFDEAVLEGDIPEKYRHCWYAQFDDLCGEGLAPSQKTRGGARESPG